MCISVTTIIQLGCTNVLTNHLVENQAEYSRQRQPMTITTQVVTDKTQYVILFNGVAICDLLKDFHLQKLVLFSAQACKLQLEAVESMSTGSVLVIMFFSGVLSYLILGMSINYFLIGARGMELIPNLAFWSEFPSLVRVRFGFYKL